MGALREPYHAQGSRFAHLETECGTKLNSPSPKKRVLRTRGRTILLSLPTRKPLVGHFGAVQYTRDDLGCVACNTWTPGLLCARVSICRLAWLSWRRRKCLKRGPLLRCRGSGVRMTSLGQHQPSPTWIRPTTRPGCLSPAWSG